jgi:hypothetical protein
MSKTKAWTCNRLLEHVRHNDVLPSHPTHLLGRFRKRLRLYVAYSPANVMNERINWRVRPAHGWMEPIHKLDMSYYTYPML